MFHSSHRLPSDEMRNMRRASAAGIYRIPVRTDNRLSHISSPCNTRLRQDDESVFWATFLLEAGLVSFEVILCVAISAAVVQEAHHLETVSLGDEFVRLRDLVLRRIDQLLHGHWIDGYVRRISLPAAIRVPHCDRL